MPNVITGSRFKYSVTSGVTYLSFTPIFSPYSFHGMPVFALRDSFSCYTRDTRKYTFKCEVSAFTRTVSEHLEEYLEIPLREQSFQVRIVTEGSTAIGYPLSWFPTVSGTDFVTMNQMR